MSLLTLQMPALRPVRSSCNRARRLLVFDMIDRICQSQPNCPGHGPARLGWRGHGAGVFVCIHRAGEPKDAGRRPLRATRSSIVSRPSRPIDKTLKPREHDANSRRLKVSGSVVIHRPSHTVGYTVSAHGRQLSATDYGASANSKY
jgi:hypothetical protein